MLGFFKFTPVSSKGLIYSNFLLLILFFLQPSCGVEDRKPNRNAMNFECDLEKGPRYIASIKISGEKGVKKVCNPLKLRQENEKFNGYGDFFYCRQGSSIEISQDGNWFRCINKDKKVDLTYEAYVKGSYESYNFLVSKYFYKDSDLQKYVCINQAPLSRQKYLHYTGEEIEHICEQP